MATPKLWKSAFQVNATDSGAAQRSAFVVPVFGGGLLTLWEDASGVYNSGGTAIVGRRFGGNGVPISGEVELSPAADIGYALADVALRPGGGVLIAFASEVAPGNNDISVRVLDAGLGVIRTDTIDSTAADTTAPAVTALADDSYVVAYSTSTGAETDIVVRIVSPTGVVGAAIPVVDEDDNSSGAALATLSNGSWAIAWTNEAGGNPSDRDIYYAVYAANGAVLSSAFNVPGGLGIEDETEPAIAALAGGGFAVVWIDTDINGSALETKGIQAAIFDNAGTSFTDGQGNDLEILVNTSIAGDQEHPAVAALADGGFIVAWSDAGAGLIRGQRFTAAGVPDGSEFTIAAGAAAGPIDLTTLPDGRVAVAFSQGTADIDSFIAIIDPRTGPITGTGGADVLFSTPDGTTVSGFDGIDTLYGAGGADILDGGPGNDAMAGGLGNDTYIVDAAGDTVIEAGGGGIDKVRSSAISLNLASYSNVENLELSGTLSLALTGNALANLLSGNAGTNTITGGRGRDSLIGGAARDIFDFNAIAETGKTSATRDIIGDFRRGTDDIDLRTIDAKSGTSANDAFKFIGTQAFHKVKGELHYAILNPPGTANDKTIVEGDVTGDGKGDFQIELKGIIVLGGGDVLL